MRPVDLPFVLRLVTGRVEDAGIDRIGEGRLIAVVSLETEEHLIVVRRIPVHTAGQGPLTGALARGRAEVLSARLPTAAVRQSISAVDAARSTKLSERRERRSDRGIAVEPHHVQVAA